MKQYYDARAAEYDDWWLGEGLHATRHRPGWHAAAAELCAAVAALPPRRTLDVACGTGFLTQHLRGEVTALDQSSSMLERARDRLPGAELVQEDALPLPFPDGLFERVFTSFFYGHLEDDDREEFLREARRLAPELVVVDSALHEDVVPERTEERILKDGSRWEVYKRYFRAGELAAELGGGEVLFSERWFVMVRA